MDYVGECPVCEEPVDESDAGYCAMCGCAFHWGSCGEWHGNEHYCNNCNDENDQPTLESDKEGRCQF